MLYRAELPLGLVQLKLQVVKLILQEVDRSVTIHHRVLKLVNLAGELGDKRSPALELGTSLQKLPISQLDRQVQGLSMVHQLSDGVTLVRVKSVETVQHIAVVQSAPTGSRVATTSTCAIRSSQSGSVGSGAGNNPNAVRTTSRGRKEQKGGHRPHGGKLPSVQQVVTDHLSHDRLPPVERVLRDHHRHTAATNSVLHKLVAIVNRWLEVTGCTQKLPKTAGKPVPVQASGVHVPLRVNDQQLFHLSQQKTDGSADGNKNY